MVIFHHKVQEIPMAAFGTNALTFMGHLGDAPGVAHRVRVMVQNASYTSVITPFIVYNPIEITSFN